MKPRSGKLRRRLRLLADAFDRFVERPLVLRFTTIAAHAAPLIAVVVGVFLVLQELLLRGWKNPVVGVTIFVLFCSIIFAQLAHRPNLCRRCQRRRPWGKDRIHAGRAALMASHHASFKIELAVSVILAVFLVGKYATMPGLLEWAVHDERVRNISLNLLLMISFGWIGQARMTHRIYERSCKRCRGRRRGGGPDGDGGEPVPVPIELPQRKTA